MLAIKRTVNVSGRIKIDTVSIKIKNETKAAGDPPGAKWAAAWVGENLIPEINSKPQNSSAIDPANQRDLDGLYTNGVNPFKFTIMIKNIKESKNRGRGRSNLFLWVNLFSKEILLFRFALKVLDCKNKIVIIIEGIHE